MEIKLVNTIFKIKYLTLNNSENVNISKIKRDFLTNSSCGVCGKSSLDALEIIKKNKTNPSEPKIKKVIVKSPDTLREDNQSSVKQVEFMQVVFLIVMEN